MTDLKVSIEGDEPEHGREPAPTAKVNDAPASRERTRAAIAERNRWVNAAVDAKADLAASRMQTIDTLSNAEAEAAKRALEMGDFDDHTADGENCRAESAARPGRG